MAEAAEWHLARGEKQVGPITTEQLHQQIAAGKVLPTDKVWREGMAEWQVAGQVPGLFGGAKPPPLTPSPPPVPPVTPYATPYSQPQPAEDIGQNAGIRMLIPVGRSGWAIAAGYLGLLSILGIFGPPALVCGILAVRDIKKNPQRHGMGRAVFGIIMGLIGTAILGLFVVGILMEATR